MSGDPDAQRVSLINKIRHGGTRGSGGVTEGLQIVPDSLLLEIKLTGQLKPSFHILHSREVTRTIILEWEAEGLVLKIFTPQGPNPGTKRTQRVLAPDALGNDEIEVRLLKLLGDLVIQRICPHFTLAVGYDPSVSGSTIRDWLGTRLPFPVQETEHFVAILAERGDTTLNKLLRSGSLAEDDLADILFQVVFTLALIQELIPSFRHNDLHLSNILLQQTASPRLDCRYHLQKNIFTLRKARYRVLLWDFYWGSIGRQDADRLGLIAAVPRDARQRRGHPNRYFDLHHFFDALAWALEEVKTVHHRQYSPELHALVDEIVPAHLKCMLTGQTSARLELWHHEYCTPREILLQHSYFAPYRGRLGGPALEYGIRRTQRSPKK